MNNTKSILETDLKGGGGANLHTVDGFKTYALLKARTFITEDEEEAETEVSLCLNELQVNGRAKMHQSLFFFHPFGWENTITEKNGTT